MESDSDRVLYCVLANEVGLLFVVEQAAADIPPILPYDASFAALLWPHQTWVQWCNAVKHNPWRPKTYRACICSFRNVIAIILQVKFSIRSAFGSTFFCLLYNFHTWVARGSFFCISSGDSSGILWTPPRCSKEPLRSSLRAKDCAVERSRLTAVLSPDFSRDEIVFGVESERFCGEGIDCCWRECGEAVELAAEAAKPPSECNKCSPAALTPIPPRSLKPMLIHGIRKEMGQPQKVALFFVFCFLLLSFLFFSFLFLLSFFPYGRRGRWKGSGCGNGKMERQQYVTQAVSRNRKPDADRWEVLRDGRSWGVVGELLCVRYRGRMKKSPEYPVYVCSPLPTLLRRSAWRVERERSRYESCALLKRCKLAVARCTKTTVHNRSNQQKTKQPSEKERERGSGVCVWIWGGL